METNRNSVIIFEEPETHAFSYHTKFLAERIALDKKGIKEKSPKYCRVQYPMHHQKTFTSILPGHASGIRAMK